ncbi:hypothetical protein GALMADRAFT_238600 [Galerina marginata CBS 339.88]|uniref:Phosphatidylglycerol/phosphatidylinositol transfer protein n=1 Tax=Galerina marginata (strain CBS 339.88) TaxID=685588 RepID=A0A067TSS4_GALM3|nr:hypothetical protein GALMADRAFT_238600 [Galerina marginata CBS 339.88]
MKFLSIIVVFVYALGANAQASHIGFPPSGTSVTPGKHLTVQVVRPNSIQGSTEAGLVIGLLTCTFNPNGCPPPNAQVGTILFNGKFSPTIHEIPGQPYQNFTVTIPTGFTTGTAQLSTNRFHLIGAGPSPILESNAVTLTVV